MSTNYVKHSPMDGKPWAGPPLTEVELRKLFWIHVWRYDPWTGQERTTEAMAADPRGERINPRRTPTFDEWHLAKYGHTFEEEYMGRGAVMQTALLRLTELMRDYVSENLRASVEGGKP